MAKTSNDTYIYVGIAVVVLSALTFAGWKMGWFGSSSTESEELTYETLDPISKKIVDSVKPNLVALKLTTGTDEEKVEKATKKWYDNMVANKVLAARQKEIGFTTLSELQSIALPLTKFIV